MVSYSLARRMWGIVFLVVGAIMYFGQVPPAQFMVMLTCNIVLASLFTLIPMMRENGWLTDTIALVGGWTLGIGILHNLPETIVGTGGDRIFTHIIILVVLFFILFIVSGITMKALAFKRVEQ